MNTTFWEKIQQGDEEAFRQLYNEYSDLLYGYGMKIAGDDDLVTESIQSLFVYLYEEEAELFRASVHIRLPVCGAETHAAE